MKVTLAINKDKGGRYWGAAYLMNNLIIENGRSQEEVCQKMQELLQRFYEIEPSCMELQVSTIHHRKAKQMVNRLRRKELLPPVTFSFNSDSFT